MPTRCERCHKETLSTTMSYFNTQMICMDCDDKERKHPKFKAAKAAEENAVRQGNYNFQGTGKPYDL